MSLFDNAIGAIQIAIEDFTSNDDRRVHGAIRNLHAGILLLCKVKLQRLSQPGTDEVLLKQKVEPRQEPDGSISWMGTGKKTVDQQAIKERFKSLGVYIEWNRLETISDIRNNTEHYYFQGTRQQALEAFADACVLIRQLLVDVLGEDPVALIGEDAWEQLYANKQVFDQEHSVCQASLSGIRWLDGAAGVAENVSCLNCGSRLVRQLNAANTDQEEADFHCTACGESSSSRDMILHVLDEMYGGENYIAAKEGGEASVITCPECSEDSYVAELGSCALCDFAVPDGAECAICGESLSPDDYHEHDGLCGYHAYVVERERDR